MSNVSEIKPRETSGTASAVVGDDVDFHDFKGKTFILRLNEKANRWEILIYSPYNQYNQYQVISLRLPNDGNVEQKTYEIVKEFDAPGKAYAAWVKATDSTYRPYTAVSGSVTVTLNISQQTAELTFNFKGESGTKRVTIKDGEATLKGFTEGKKNHVPGAVTCDLSEAVTAHYVSTVTELAKKSEQVGFPAHLQVWSQQFASKPEPLDYRLVINVANGLLPGTYSFSPDSKQVRITFFNTRQNIAWVSERGSITLKSLPDPETLKGDFSGEFNFKATATLGDGSVLRLEANQGKIDIK